MTQQHSVAISIVTYHSAALLPRCLETLLPYPVYVWDNNSRDETASLMRAQYPWVHFTESRENLGFGRAHNQILTKLPTDTDYALVLNPDCFISVAALERLLQTAEENPNAALIGAAYADIPHPHAPNAPAAVAFLSGACLLLRLSVFRQIGFFDPNIFLFYEDNEICDRARAAGHTVLFEPRAVVTHIGAASTAPTVRGVWRRQRAMGWSHAYYQKKRGKSAASRYASPARKVLRGLRTGIMGDKLEAAGCIAHAFGTLRYLTKRPAFQQP